VPCPAGALAPGPEPDEEERPVSTNKRQRKRHCPPCNEIGKFGPRFLSTPDPTRSQRNVGRHAPCERIEGDHCEQNRDPRIAKPSGREQAILAITPRAIESALWLSLYGFADIPNRQMDGAYHRSCILSELHNFDRVIVCRPLANGWSRDAWPKSYFDVRDWNTEMWFSVGYKAEVDAMKRVNSLVDSGAINDPSYRLVDIHDVEPTTPAGYFNYFIERGSVFEDARSKADALFRWLKSGKIGQKP
jgi:hypothetical protein